MFEYYFNFLFILIFDFVLVFNLELGVVFGLGTEPVRTASVQYTGRQARQYASTYTST